MKPEIITGAEIVIRSLQKESVDFVFGYPGGAVLNIYDAIFNQKHFKHVLVRHEQAAVHAADAFSRSSGKVGVALVTSGPGATNAVTGIATAYMDSVPMVIISGQVPTHAIGEDAFQECDTVGITRPCVKHNFLVKDVKKIASTMKKAFYLASSGRPGPVLVDIPKDITAEKTEFIYPDKINLQSELENVGLIDWFQRYENGLDQDVGERGANVSAGERQFIALLRAVLAKRQIIVFDEATANLDIESESSILDATDRLLTYQTSIVIAHRLETILNAEKILVMSEGKLVGFDNHENLLAKNEIYQQLFSAWNLVN